MSRLKQDFRPKKPKHARNMTREMGNFDKAVKQASQGLVEAREKAKLEYEQKLQEALQEPEIPVVEHIDHERPRLEAGCTIFYWQPGRIMGNPDAMCYSKVLEVYSQERIAHTKCPIRLDSGHVLNMEHEVQIVDDSKSNGMFRLNEYELVSSTAEGKGAGERIHEMLDAQVKQLKEENPQFASLIGNQLGGSGPRSNPGVGHQSKQAVALSSKKGPKRCFESLMSDSDSDSANVNLAPSTVKKQAKKPRPGKKLLNGKTPLPPRNDALSDSSEDLPELGSQSSRPTSIRAKPEPSPKPRAKAKAKTTASQAAVKAKRKTTKPKAKVPRKTAAIKAGVKAKTKTECGKIVAKDAEKHSPVQQHWAQRLKVLPMKIPKKSAAIQKNSSKSKGDLSSEDEDNEN